MSFAIHVQPMRDSIMDCPDRKTNPKGRSTTLLSKVLGWNSDFLSSLSRPFWKSNKGRCTNGNFNSCQVENRAIPGVNESALFYGGSYRCRSRNLEVICNVTANRNDSYPATAEVNLRKNVFSNHSCRKICRTL